MGMLDIYKALADESRLRLLSILSKGYFNVQELTGLLSLGQSTISHHLKILQAAGLTKMHKEGTWAYYTLRSSESGRPAELILGSFLRASGSDGEDDLIRQFRDDAASARRIVNSRREDGHRYFEAVASDWKSIREEAQGAESFFDRLGEKIPDDDVLLDLGCGSGAFLEHVLPRSGATIGVDYSQAMLEETRRMLAARRFSADIRLGNLEHLPLGDASIDCAVAYMVLHHVPTPQEALLDAARVLRPGGRLLIVDLAKHSDEYMRERYADLWLGFDREELQRWIAAAGFAEVCSEPLGAEEQAFLLTATKKEMNDE